MTVIAIVPIKRLSGAKTRLAGKLTVAERGTLALALLEHVLTVLAESPSIDETIVVSPDPEVLRAVDARCAIGLPQPGDGLNQAILLGRDEALRRGATGLLIALADLPMLAAADIDAIVTCGEGNTIVLAPDRHGRGTNLLFMRPVDAIEPAFGAESLVRHRLAAAVRGLPAREYRSAGTGFDIDTPADFDDFQQLENPSWRTNSGDICG